MTALHHWLGFYRALEELLGSEMSDVGGQLISKAPIEAPTRIISRG